MTIPIYTLNLNHKVLPGCVTIGSYDGIHPCLTAATSAERIFIHSPHKRVESSGGRLSLSESSKEVVLLNVNQTITAICAGRLDPTTNKDVLVVGSPTNLLAYDVDSNMDLFFKEVPDGVRVITIGSLGSMSMPLAIIGGNCSLQGFDLHGNDPFWTVTGDNVCSLALVDFDLDGENELIVGSEDYDIRVFKDDNIVGELTETEAVTSLIPLKGNNFGYGLSNGTVGVYEKLQRWWRIKSKNKAISVFSYDIDGDGIDELITGWSNGKIDGRNSRTGEVVFKDNMSHCVAGIVSGDYRITGAKDLICCSVEGEVRGYQSASTKDTLPGTNVAQDTVRELFARKQHLLMELSNYKGNEKYASNNTQPRSANNQDDVGVIPAKTKLQTSLDINLGDSKTPPHVEIVLCTNNETIIRAVLVFGEGIFDGESYVIHPKEGELSSRIVVFLHPPHNVPVDLHIKAMVGYRDSHHYHIFELTRQMPRFAMFALLDSPVEKPKGFSSFSISERVQRVALWINQNFLIESEVNCSGELDIYFRSLRNQEIFSMNMSSTGHMNIYSNDMGLVGELTQSLAMFLNLEELQVKADFPVDQDNMCQLMEKVSQLQEVRVQLGADMADASSAIRSLVVRAEDARLIGDIYTMKKWYTQLSSLNGDLLRAYKIRNQNHLDLLEALKQLNQGIQKASKLRVGSLQSKVISLCRTAVKNNSSNSLIRIIKTGEA